MGSAKSLNMPIKNKIAMLPMFEENWCSRDYYKNSTDANHQLELSFYTAITHCLNETSNLIRTVTQLDFNYMQLLFLIP